MDYWQMDYCSSCRRHLNGALVCPGCGAYAPDIAPDPREKTEPEPAYAEPLPDVEGAAAPLPEGRAARRRQRVRWKKSRRRALVATAVALVGGGLTLTTMDRGGSTDRARTAAAPDELTLDTTHRQPAERIHPTATQPETRRRAPEPAATQSPDAVTSRAKQRPATTTPYSAPPEALAASEPTTAPRVPHHRTVSPVPPAQTAPTAVPTTPQPAAPPADAGTRPSAPEPATTPAPTATPTSPQLCVLVVCLG